MTVTTAAPITHAENAFAALGRELNLRSRRQLQLALFDQLELPRTPRDSVSTPALRDLYAQTGSEFVGHVLRHRGVDVA